MWPMVPTLTCGLLRWKTPLAITGLRKGKVSATPLEEAGNGTPVSGRCQVACRTRDEVGEFGGFVQAARAPTRGPRVGRLAGWPGRRVGFPDFSLAVGAGGV